MRTTYSVFAAMLLLSATPSISFAQIVVAYGNANHVAPLKHLVPVATVTAPDEAIALADPKRGVDFVLGSAQLDIKDPNHPMIVFTVTNRTDRPIPPTSVNIQVASVFERDGQPRISICGSYGVLQNMLRNNPGSSAIETATLAPGATVTMAMPVGPSPCLVAGGPSIGFLVHLTSDRVPGLRDNLPRLRRALEALRSQAEQ